VRLANKTALMTGGNSGIGLATARLFVAEGAKVVITGRNKETLAAAAKELGPNAFAVVADATDIAATEAAIKQGAEKFGRYDIVFANAGIPGHTPVGGTTLAAFETVIRTNLTAVFFTVQAAVAHLNDGASVILNGSVKLYSSKNGKLYCELSLLVSNSIPDPMVNGSNGSHVSDGVGRVCRILA